MQRGVVEGCCVVIEATMEAGNQLRKLGHKSKTAKTLIVQKVWDVTYNRRAQIGFSIRSVCMFVDCGMCSIVVSHYR
jgi:hypothetical protein